MTIEQWELLMDVVEGKQQDVATGNLKAFTDEVALLH